jgi:HAD superfamily hydrolase (TIGR01509 family)
MTHSWVVFDLDGTLIESEEIWAEIRRTFVLENGGHWRDDAQSTMIGMRTTEWARYIHDTLGVPLAAPEIATRVVDAVVARMKEGVPVLPGADEALQRIASAFPLALATSASRPVADAVLEETGWRKLFSVFVSADEVERGKPAPDVYLRALEEAGAAPHESAAIEDSENGIRSAHAAQLAVIAIPNPSFPPHADALALATSVLSNLTELTPAVVYESVSMRAIAPNRPR